MIVITTEERVHRVVGPGDVFSLTITDHSTGQRDILSEEITVNTVITYYCAFRFAREDGTVIGFHLAGFFGNEDNLPDEIRNATHMDDLTPAQRRNFEISYGALARRR